MNFINTGRNLFLTLLLSMALSFFSFNPALAATVQSDSVDTARQAADEVVKSTGVKEQFGQSENGDRLLDGAQQEANKKLKKLADKADSENLPDSKKLFLDNLTNKN